MKAFRLIFCCMLLAAALPPFPAYAQQTLNPDRNEPLEITAEQTLEWHRNEKQYIARGNVFVRQGEVTIAADLLTADYRETAQSDFEIYRLTATGNVRISSQGNTATGEKAVYEVDKGMAVMTGNNLTLTSPDQSVAARDSFEYWVAEGRLTARGAARVTRGEDRLDADTVSAIFTENAKGARQLKSLTADGNVKITTPTEVLTGNKGRYDAASNTAQISGEVKITRGPNILEGDRADVNLTTNVSTMQGSPAAGGRVRGVFYPGSEDGQKAAPSDAPQAQPAPSPAPPEPDSQGRQRLLLGR